MDHGDRIAKIRRRPGDAVDAHVAHAAHDHQFLDALFVEDRFQFGFAERVDEVFEHHRFVGTVEHFRVQLRALGVRGEKRRIFRGEFVANVHH
ncbi:hypothetical protein D9M71_764260 [compost metagenome]